MKIKLVNNCAYHEEVEFMKKIVVTVLVVLISIAFVFTCFAQSKTPPTHVTQKKMAPEKTTKQGKATPPKKHIAKPKASGFVGQVAIVDGNLIQVKGAKEEVTFDASSPVLRGYTAISDVMVGDTVAADYTKDGLMITKMKVLAKEKKVAKGKKITPKKHIAKPKASGFVGQVAIVDGNLIQVKGTEEEVTFDASSPVLRGYTAISDVMVGDTVAADSTKDGLMITKMKEASGEKKAEKAKRIDKEETVRLFTCKGLSPCTVSVYKAIE